MGVILDILRFFFSSSSKGGSSNLDTRDVSVRLNAAPQPRHKGWVPIGDVLPPDVVESLKMAMPAAAFAQFERGVPPSFLARFDKGLPPEMMIGLADMLPAETIERLNQSLIENARMRASGGTAAMPAQTAQPEFLQPDAGISRGDRARTELVGVGG